MIVDLLLRHGAEQLAPFIEDPLREAQLLLSFVWKKSREKLIAWSDEICPETVVRAFYEVIEKRAKGTPMAYLIGEKAFWDITLYVNNTVLIPRPETELLVELALGSCFKGCSILELGTGSGAISCAIAKARPDIFVTATDNSKAALLVAITNAERLGLCNIVFHERDWFHLLPEYQFDRIISNPPYIPEQDPHLLQGDLRFEPRMALASGSDGLEAIRGIIVNAGPYLKPGGKLLLEHGYDQAAEVRDLLLQQGFCDIKTHCDLAGHERATVSVLPLA